MAKKNPPVAVEVSDRMNFVVKHIGANSFAMRYETVVQTLARKYSRAYDGGYWEFKEFTKKVGGKNVTAFFMELVSDETFEVSNADNYFDGTMTAAQFSLGLNIIAQSILMGALNGAGQDTDALVDKWHVLREFAFDQPNSGVIIRFID
jgi:hypothetical protein